MQLDIVIVALATESAAHRTRHHSLFSTLVSNRSRAMMIRSVAKTPVPAA